MKKNNKLNNRGFTIIELAVSFCMVSVISLLLFQVVLSLKDIYLSGNIKTTLLNKQGILTKKIYDDLNERGLTSVSSCGLSCLAFTYSDNETVQLMVDPGNKTINYGTYALELDKSSDFGDMKVEIDKDDTILANSILTIDIPIYFKLLEGENFGIKIIKRFNSNFVNVSNSLELTNSKPVLITLDGIKTNLTLLDSGSGDLDIFARLFFQTKSIPYTEAQIFKKDRFNNSPNISALSGMEAFRITSDIDSIVNKEKENNLLKSDYQNGYFSLMYLQNNNLKNVIDTSSGVSNNYFMRWYQTNNFSKKEPVKGFYVGFDDGSIIKNNNCSFEGLSYTNKNNAFITGCDSGYYQLGSTNSSLLGATGEIDNVELWAEARDYICKYSLSDVTYNGIHLKEKFCS